MKRALYSIQRAIDSIESNGHRWHQITRAIRYIPEGALSAVEGVSKEHDCIQRAIKEPSIPSNAMIHQIPSSARAIKFLQMQCADCYIHGGGLSANVGVSKLHCTPFTEPSMASNYTLMASNDI